MNQLAGEVGEELHHIMHELGVFDEADRRVFTHPVAHGPEEPAAADAARIVALYEFLGFLVNVGVNSAWVFDVIAFDQLRNPCGS